MHPPNPETFLPCHSFNLRTPGGGFEIFSLTSAPSVIGVPVNFKEKRTLFSIILNSGWIISLVRYEFFDFIFVFQSQLAPFAPLLTTIVFWSCVLFFIWAKLHDDEDWEIQVRWVVYCATTLRSAYSAWYVKKTRWKSRRVHGPDVKKILQQYYGNLRNCVRCMPILRQIYDKTNFRNFLRQSREKS